jgi:hypothetical protein
MYIFVADVMYNNLLLFRFQGGSQGMMFGNQSTTTTQVSIPKDVSSLSIPKDVSACRRRKNHYILRKFHSANFVMKLSTVVFVLQSWKNKSFIKIKTAKTNSKL